MSEAPMPGSEHEQIWDLLPMLAIGRLAGEERLRVERHVAHCSACQQELALERRIAAAVRAEPEVERSPEPGLALLMARINAPALPRRPERAPSPRPSRWQRLLAELSGLLPQPARDRPN